MYGNLAEIVKGYGSPKLEYVVEVLTQRQDILTHMPFYAANAGTIHRYQVRGDLPEGQFVSYNEGIPTVKGKKEIIEVATKRLAAKNTMDEALVEDLGGNQARADDAKATIQGLSRQMSEALIYGNSSTNPKEFDGLAKLYPSLSDTNNVLNAGGTGSALTSIYLVSWGKQGAYGIYPQHSQAGLKTKDLGKVQETDKKTGNTYTALQTEFQWRTGLVVENPACVKRIANIDITDANISSPSSSTYLIDLILEASEMFPSSSPSTPILYCARPVLTLIRKMMTKQNNVNYTFENVGGKQVMNLMGLQTSILDSIILTEDAIV